MGKINEYFQRRADDFIARCDRQDAERQQREEEAPPLFITRANGQPHELLEIKNRPDD